MIRLIGEFAVSDINKQSDGFEVDTASVSMVPLRGSIGEVYGGESLRWMRTEPITVGVKKTLTDKMVMHQRVKIVWEFDKAPEGADETGDDGVKVVS